MPRTCTICSHPERSAIERDLIAGQPSFRDIARQYGVTKDAVARHKADHLPRSLAKAHAAQEIARADTLLADVRSGGDRAERLYNSAELILERALESKDLKTALAAISGAVNVMREGRAYLELRGEITGELNPPPAAPQPGINSVLQVLLMPKTPEAAAIERERLAKFGPPRITNGQDLKNAEPMQPKRLGPTFDPPSGEDESGD